MAKVSVSPKEWIASAFPVKTVCGVRVVYDKRSYDTQYYSLEWLVETFGEQIETADNPQQRLREECERRGYVELQDLFSNEAR
jgi:hypothetical protein